MLQLTSLRKEFDNLVAVENLTLTIPAGEIYGLIGPNGAGKTTTIRMMSGLLVPTQGSVHVGHVNVQEDPEHARQYIGYLSDFFAVYEDLKVWEYLDYFAHAYKMPEEKIASRVDDVIAQIGLETKRDSLIRGLSRGMKQRLGIARAIIHRPKVLLLDEPASGLDPKARLELRNLLRSLREQGSTILVSSHILTELEGFCTSIGIMERGRLIRTGRVEDITSAENSSRMIRMQWLGDPTESVRSVLAAMAGTSEISLNHSTGTFRFSGTDEELSDVLSHLVANQVRVLSFVETRQTVEELYMKVSHHEVM